MTRIDAGCVLLIACLVGGCAIGCGETGSKGAAGLGAGAAAPPPVRGAPAASARGDGDGGVDGGGKVEFQEQEFVETERNRDPFRSFAKSFADQSRASTAAVQRDVILERYSIDDLRLVGIVTGAPEHRAMLVDPLGKGWIVKRGQFIGKEEVVHGKGPTGADYALNWRVDRIRDGDIVLVREDPAHSDVPPATRVIPLRPEANEGERH